MMTLQDFKYALRLLIKRPGFTLLTTVVMAVGLGLSIYLFSFLNTMAYKALPFEDGDSLVVFDKLQDGAQFNGGRIDLHDYLEIRNNLKGVSELGAYSETSVNVSGRDGARRYNAVEAEPNIFAITRTKPILGRVFTDAENKQGAEEVTVIGYDLWQNQFGGDPQILEQKMLINSVSTRIIGVMPEGYYFPRNADIWKPMRQDATQLERGKAGNYSGLGHLNPGVSMADINNQLTVIMKRLEQQYPKTNAGVGAYVTTFPMSTMGGGGNIFILSMYMVAILLLILASVNVGNLLLSRAVERSKETAIRVALGAPRARLIGQMLWESIIICTTGGVIGLLVAAWGLEVTESITATFTDDKPFFWWKFGIDSFTLKIFFSFVSGTILLTGLLPAWKNSGNDFNSVLRDGTRGALGKKAGRLNRFLVISEVFLSLTVLIAAGVMVIGTFIATHTDYGAETKNTLTARVRLIESDYDTPEKRAQFVTRLQNELENNVGVGDVMISSALPGDGTWSPNVAIEGVEYADERYPRANYIVGTQGSLKKLGVELKQGRYFDASDDGIDKSTVIVTESFAKRHFFNGQSALGKRVRIAEIDGDTPRWLTIVGVVENTIQGQAIGPQAKIPSIFRPITQAPRLNISIAMRMKADITVAIHTLRKSLALIDPNIPAYIIQSYNEKIARNSAGIGFASKIFLIFGLVAAVLASSGIYGVMSNTMNQRTQEIGIRRALGANETRITKDYMLTGLKQLLWGGFPGLLAGCGLGLALSQMMSVDNTTLVAIALVMLILIGSVVLFATYLPTKRVLQMEPSEALHCE